MFRFSSRYTIIGSALFIFMVSINFSFAATYKAFHAQGRDIISLNGAIKSGESKRFENFIATHENVQYILLQSLGGSVNEAIKIGKIIKQSKLKTAVETYCYSACFITLMSGEPRYVYQEAYVGVHRPYFEKDKIVQDTKHSSTYCSLAHYFQFLLGDNKQSHQVVSLIYKTPSKDMYQVSPSESFLDLNYYSHSAL
ncbi:hypothetical protein [Vibrio algivorus]|uniref:Uncharacterized protein n=1 Tax=Vibrio algivorus TaxID=1667024 RepID=A0A557NZB6_9VIBR|nr:hypothetical protein [Vibrio algivorus]TVO33751.1 hypothetical protein FOF44_14655 [Vibrio algivorus]GLT13565.1 hypothetical protein GCM10007931_05390 [Vibrio algivorus]